MSTWTWGKVAYEKYLDYWVKHGYPLGAPTWPDWEDLDLNEKEAWSGAAQAVREAAAK